MNVSTEGIAITTRFFLVIDNLINRRKIRGLKTFTDKYSLKTFTTIDLGISEAS